MLSNVLATEGGQFKDPQAAEKLVYGSWGMELFKRFAERSYKGEQDRIRSVRPNRPKFNAETKTQIIGKLTSEKAGSNSPTFEDVVRTAPKETLNEIYSTVTKKLR